MSQDQQAIVVKEAPARPGSKPRKQPPFKVILLNDDVNDFSDVLLKVHRLTPLTLEESLDRVREAHFTGQALLLVTHKERAELYQEQFASLIPPLGIAIEPAEE